MNNGLKKTKVRCWKGAPAWARAIVAAGIFTAMLSSIPALAVNLTAPPSLKTMPVPEPPNLGLFLFSDPGNLNAGGYPVPTEAARDAAIVLGKALFWDMQVGSDGIQACATCHFHAGTDNRKKGVLNPGLINTPPDPTFQLVTGNNAVLAPSMFPLMKFQNPEDRFSAVLRDVNDVVSSPGIHKTVFAGLPQSGAIEQGIPSADGVFHVAGKNTRRVPPRNAPTMINAVFNYANFWDGRANNVFNGVNPFGDADQNAAIYVNIDGVLTPQNIRIPMASLASQAVGPPGNDFEMSFSGRSFPLIGKKLLTLVPLGKQRVHRKDSVLGPFANPIRGLNTTYDALIRAAFQPQYWNSAQMVSSGNDEFTHMEANFSLFFGLAIQLYEATLVSDETPFDRFQEGDDSAMSVNAQMGLNIFLTDPAGDPQIIGGACFNCHGGSEFTNASVSHIGSTFFGDPPEMLIENMATAAGPNAFYDAGYYDIAVRPVEEDLGRGGTDPFGYPLSFTERALLADNGSTLPLFSPPLNPPLPCGINAPKPCPLQASAMRGSFKTPGLRNVELTGPFFHNGSAATLAQVIDLYVRGGNFRERNIATVAPDINTLNGLKLNPLAQSQLIDFLLALTDERVRLQQAPFDHPELFIPNGADGNSQSVTNCDGAACDTMLRVPAVGRFGLPAEKRLPVATFLGVGQHQP